MRPSAAALRRVGLLALTLGASGCSDVFLHGIRITVVDYELLGSRRVDRDHFDFTYRARCRNQGPEADAVVAVLESHAPSTAVVEGVLRCGPVAAAGVAESLDTFTIRQDRTVPFDPSALRWIVASIGPLEATDEDVGQAGALRTRRRYRVAVSNGTEAAQAMLALLSSSRSSVEVSDDRALLVVAPGETTVSVDTVDTLRARGSPLDTVALALTLQVAPSASGGAAVVQTLDGVGHPLGGVRVEESSPRGLTHFSTDGETGFATLGQGGGELTFRFSREDYTPVWRRIRIDGGKVAVVPSPRLSLREPSARLGALEDGTTGSGDGSVRVRFPAGAFPEGAEARVTTLDGQSLPLLLPSGWSPLAGFWLELSAPNASAGVAEIALDEGVRTGDRAALVHLDEEGLGWKVVETLPAGDRVTASLAGPGAFAVVVADEGGGAPDLPAPGAHLAGGTALAPDPASLAAVGSVAPEVSAASLVAQEVTGAARLELSAPAPIPSGLVLQLALDERYALQDGRTLSLPEVTSFVVAYRRPGSGDERRATARFPLRPRELLAGDVLAEALLHARISAVAEFSGGVLTERGGTLSAPGVEVLAAAGDLEGTRPARIEALDAASFTDLLPGDASARVAFELAVDGISTDRALRASFAPQAPNATFVLARVVSGGGLEGLEPVERLASDAAGIVASTEPVAGERLPGIVRGGRYVLVQVPVRQGLVRATVSGVADPSTSVGVSVTAQPWLVLGAVGASFRLLAPPGVVEAVARELASADEGRASGALADSAAVLALGLEIRPTGPRVTTVEPASGARGVSPVTPVRVRFSEPLAPGSFGPDGLVLRDAAGGEIAGTLSLDLSRTTATFLPASPLASRTDYRLELAAEIRDTQGLPIEGDRAFGFTTALPAARGAGAQLVLYEPGAETAACDDVPGVDRRAPTVVCATGSQGTADPDVAVVLVNESTGVTSTVRSREDGSFEGFVDAAEDDLVSATFVNANGTRVQVPVSKQLFDDGSVGLFALGGTVEAELPTGTAEVVVEPGAIAGKTKLRLRAIPPEIQAQVIGDTPPEIGTLLGQGLVLEASGDPLRVPPDVRIDVDEAALVSQGFDLSQPDEATFALVQPREIDGVLGYQILDKLEYEDGKLVSHSPPFPGPNPTAAPEDFGRTLDLCNQNAGAIAVLDELNRALELTLFLLDPSGLGFVTEKIMFWPLTMAIRARPTLFTGKVEEIVPSGICLVGARPLRGALVTVRAVTGPGQLTPQRPGRLDPGESFAIADSKGKYALLLPRVANDEPHAITGQHPRHVGLRVVEPANEFVLPDPFSFLLSPNEFPNPTSYTDLLFPAPLGGTTEQPPQVTVAHVPLLPAPTTPAQVKVFGVHGLGAPTVALSLVDVKPLGSGSTPSLSDVSITEGVSENVGATGVRKSFTVLAEVPALVILKATASVQGSNPAEVEYAVEFGGELPPPAGGLPVSDPNDRVPPIAVNTWPADGAVGLTPGSPIEVNFSEPVKKDLLTSFTAVSLSGPGAGGDPHLELSPDQMRLTVGTGGLEPGESYTLTLTSAIEDLAGNDFDGDPSTPDADSLSIQFRTAPIVTGTIPIELGASAVMQGIYAFALDRQGTTEGALVVVDMSDSDEPKEKARFNLPAFPRDLALVPEYSIVRKAGEPAEERTLVAVVGGLVGGSTASQGEFTGGGQYLILVDVTNPLAPQRFASALLTLGASVLVPRVVWSPPFLGYIQSGADLQAVGVLNLQTFALGTNTPLAQQQTEFPVLGTPGIDANGDGDYTDPGEELPLPCRCPGELAGKLLGFAIDGTTQKINDLAVDGGSGYFGAAISGGLIRNAAGNPTGPAVSPTYRTFFKAGPIAVPDGDFGFAASDDPKRVRFFAGVPILVNGVPTPTDLALVSVNDLATSRGRVVVLDVTDPFDPKQRNAIDIDPGHGLLQSVELRDDGLFVFATSNDLLLFDPAQLVVPQPPGEPHPGIVAKVPGAGSGQRTFMSLSAGLQVVNLGSKSQVVQTAPLLSFVRVPGVMPFDPDDLSSDRTLRERVLEKLELAGAVFPSRATAEAGVPSDLDPPSPLTHYYVRVDAPGSAGGTSGELPIALESLDLGGQPLRNQGLLYPPVRAMEPISEQQIGESPREPCDPETKPLDAHRLSDDPADPDYNVFLAGPFVLVIEEMPEQLLDLLRDGSPERIVLWSGFTLRATLDPRIPLSNPVGPFASVPDFARSVLKPGAGAFAFTFPGDYLLGPNPAPLVGGATVPASYGAVQAHSGEVRLSDEDLSLDGRGLEIRWTRTYGAQDLYDGPLGRGWDFTYNQRLRELSPESFGFGSLPLVDRGDPAKSDVARGGDVVFYDGEGEAVLFRNAGDSAPPEVASDPLVATLGFLAPGRVRAFYLPPRGVFELLFQFVDGRFARLTRDGRQFWYEPDGRLATIYDRYDTNAIKLRYNQRGQLVRILDELDRAIEVGWYRAATDPAFGTFDVASSDPKRVGHIARVRDYSSREVRYEYDANGLLERRVGPTITQAALGGFTGDDEVRYLYTSCEDPAESASALRGTIEGGASGTPIVSATSYSSGARDQVSSLSTASGSVGVSIPGANSAAALGGKRATFQGPDGLSIEYLFNELGQPERVTHGGVRTFEQTFNPDGLLERLEFPEGNAIEYVYDSGNAALRARANLLETRRLPVGAGTAGADPTYVSLSPHDGRYNVPAGTQTDFAGKTYNIVIDAFGRDADRIEYPNGDKATFQRNAFGQIEVETSADGIVTTTTHNGDGWPETMKSGSLPAERFTYGGLAGLRGLPSRVRDARAIDTDLTWNERDQLVRSERAGSKEEWGYDRIGRQEAQATKLGPGGVVLPGGIPPEGRTIVERRKFDASGFLERVTVENVEVQGSVQPLEFKLFPDAAKRLSRIEFPSGETKRFFYDGLGQLEHTEVGEHAEFFTYDDNGTIESRRVGNATDVYALDGHRRVKEWQHPGGGRSITRYDGNDAILSELVEDPVFGKQREREFVYDVRGRQERTRVLLGNGGASEATISFDPAQRSMTRTEANGAQLVSTWDDAGRPASITTPFGTRTSTLDENGNPLSSVRLESGRTYELSRTFNDLDQQISLADGVGPLAIFEPRFDGAVRRTIDAAGRVLTHSLSLLGEPLAVEKPNGVREEREYDARRRLRRIADDANHASTIGFDASLRLVDTIMPGGLSTVFSGFNAEGNPERVLLSGAVQIDHVVDVRGRPEETTFGAFAGLPARQEAFTYDTLDRVRRAEYPGGSVEFDYDGLSTVREVRTELGGALLRVRQTPDLSGNRTHLEYPSIATFETRDPGGRLLALAPAGLTPVVGSTSFVGAEIVGSRVLGGGALRFDTDVDGRKRPLFRRYTNASGDVLVDLRYRFDAVDDLVSRQRVDRGGRSDLYTYDAGHRLTRVDHGARPAIPVQGPRPFLGFISPATLPGAWAPGLYAREMSFDDVDVLTAATTVAPQAVNVSPFATSYAAVDAALHTGEIDGFVRTRDVLGNTSASRLQARDSGLPDPVALEATLTHDQSSRLARVARTDGAVVENRFDTFGLRTRRTVTCAAATVACEPSDRFYLHHGGLLLEEYEGGVTPSALLARYYYDDDGEPLAMDRRVSGGSLSRFYFLTDLDGSVVALADASGRVIERVLYDAWGEPTIERADDRPPRVRRVVVAADGAFLVELSERVLPALLRGDGPEGPESAYEELAKGFVLRPAGGGSALPASIEYAEAEVGFDLGTVLRVQPGSVAAQDLVLEIAADALRDEWNLPIEAAAIPVRSGSPAGTVIFANPDAGSTAPTRLGRSSVGSPFLFHGEYFDYETGLVYLRSRFYQPSTGLFLERDPNPYSDSVNAYAGMMNNPVAFRDPTGASVLDVLKVAGRAAVEAASKGARAIGRGVRAVGRATGGFSGGFSRKATALVSRLDRSANRVVGQLDDTLGGSYQAAAQAARRADAAPPRAREIASNLRASRSANVPEPTAAAAPAAARAAPAPVDLPPRPSPSPVDLPPRPAPAPIDLPPLVQRSAPAPLLPGEVNRIQEGIRRFKQSPAGQVAEARFRQSRAERAIELYPDLDGINPRGGTTNCVRCQNALAKNRSSWTQHTAETYPQGSRGADDVYNPLNAQWAENISSREVVARVKAAGPGAEFHLRGVRGPGATSNHRMGVVNNNGVVHFLDGQAESFANLSDSGYVTFWLMRYR